MSIPPERKLPISGRAVDDPSFYQPEPVSFVRRGSRLHGRRADAWERTASKYIIDLPRDRTDTSVGEGYTFDSQEIYGRKAPLIVEIGSGLGEAMAYAAGQDRETDFLAVEVYRPGLAALMVRVENSELTNVRAVQANAPEALDSMLPAGSASEIWIFFSDPWHKIRHHKRRLIKESFLPKLERVLEPGGIVRLATDWSNYAEQMREVFDAAPAFTNLHPGELSGEDSNLTKVRRLGLEKEDKDPDFIDELGGWAPRFEGRTLTSFEGKALKAGRLIFDLAYRKAL
ncbi:tRNA (guanosine(46)-N7)-methyltransferase TrmB [Paeniglutamicibacter sp. MACA_103]|uniref:tRNA (guanosine(46)-N7)-methyltransferase TrmB n=1 Tax=Paeniglutamicibacter sp. MACA_103 TaxID=3377337 RepID=UPI0038965BE8